MTKEALTLALEALTATMSTHGFKDAIDEVHDKAITAIKEALAQPEQEKERCVGCEACIDTACGRDECPKGWPKAAQPDQEPVPDLYVKDINGNFRPYKEKGHTENCAAFGDDCSENHLPPSRFGVGKCNFIPKEILLSHLKRAEGAEEVTLPIDFFRDLLYQAMPRTWVGLTDDEINDIVHNHDELNGLWELIDMVEAKLKEKNT